MYGVTEQGGIMAKLHVEAVPRWATGTPDYQSIPVLLLVSVSDDAGVPVTGLHSSSFDVHWLANAETPIATYLSDFREYSHLSHLLFPQFAGGYYSFVVVPVDVRWNFPQEFLMLSVRNGSDHGQTLCLAQYYRITYP